MDKSYLLSELGKLNNKNQYEFFKMSYFLRESFASGTLLKGPYNLILDNNIFIRLEELKANKLTPNILAVLVFFDWYKQQFFFRARISVFPTVFYEFARKSPFQNLNEYWDKFQYVRETFEKTIDLELFNDERIIDFNSANDSFQRVMHDEGVIFSELTRIKDYRFEYAELEKHLLERGFPKEYFKNLMPDVLTSLYINSVDTEYFSDNVIYKLIEEYILERLNKVAKVKEHFGFIPTPNHLKSVVKIKKKSVSGIGDLEMFLRGNIISQNELQKNGRNYYPNIPLTLDEKLFKTLKKNSVMINGWKAIAGKDNDVFKSIMERDYIDQKRRIPYAKENMARFYNDYEEYFNEYIMKSKNVD